MLQCSKFHTFINMGHMVLLWVRGSGGFQLHTMRDWKRKMWSHLTGTQSLQLNLLNMTRASISGYNYLQKSDFITFSQMRPPARSSPGDLWFGDIICYERCLDSPHRNALTLSASCLQMGWAGWCRLFPTRKMLVTRQRGYYPSGS